MAEEAGDRSLEFGEGLVLLALVLLAVCRIALMVLSVGGLMGGGDGGRGRGARGGGGGIRLFWRLERGMLVLKSEASGK